MDLAKIFEEKLEFSKVTAENIGRLEGLDDNIIAFVQALRYNPLLILQAFWVLHRMVTYRYMARYYLFR